MLRELLSPRVVYGKDRQEDNSSFILCSSDVLDTFNVYNKSSLYLVHRFPETLFSHKKDALNHHEIKAISSFIWHPRLELFYIADSFTSSIWVCKNSSIMKLQKLDPLVNNKRILSCVQSISGMCFSHWMAEIA